MLLLSILGIRYKILAKKLLESTVSTGFWGLEAETVETVDFNSFAKSGYLERSVMFLFGFI